MSPVEQAIIDCLARQKTGGRITVALSGGIDSMVLLDALHRVQKDFSNQDAPNRPSIGEFDALHVHHGLSPNADAWANFCQRECDARGIRLTVARVNVDRSNTEGQGIEGAARAARYAAFQQHAGKCILAAQHADDQAETVLHQMLRGTGLAGLAAMGPARALPSGQVLLRPLLNVSRAEIEAYAATHDVRHMHDESNDDTAYTRNFIRHEVMPMLAQRFPHAASSLGRVARHAADSAEMLDALAKVDLTWNGTDASAEHLDSLPLARQTNALYHWLKWQGVSSPSSTQLESWAEQLFRPSPTDKPHQAGGHDFVIRRQRGKLSLQRLN